MIEFGNYNMVLWYERWAYADSLTSTFINRNSFATYAGLSLLATMGLTFNEFRRGAAGDMMSLSGFRWLLEQLTGRLGVLLLMTATLGSALLLTGSRGGMASFTVGLLLLSLGFIFSPGSRPTVGIIITAVCALLVTGLMALRGEAVLARFESTNIMDIEGRATVYRVVYEAILDNTWAGVGYGTFETSFPMVRDATVTSQFIYDKAHNSYLEFAFEAGVPAFALMMGLLGGLVALCVHGNAVDPSLGYRTLRRMADPQCHAGLSGDERCGLRQRCPERNDHGSGTRRAGRGTRSLSERLDSGGRGIGCRYYRGCRRGVSAAPRRLVRLQGSQCEGGHFNHTLAQPTGARQPANRHRL